MFNAGVQKGFNAGFDEGFKKGSANPANVATAAKDADKLKPLAKLARRLLGFGTPRDEDADAEEESLSDAPKMWRFSFQPGTRNVTLPSGWLADTGGVFGPRSGAKYGWSCKVYPRAPGLPDISGGRCDKDISSGMCKASDQGAPTRARLHRKGFCVPDLR